MSLVYILSYDPFNGSITPTQLQAFIKDSRKIDSWHSPFAGTYFLKSSQPLPSLIESFGPIFNGAQYVITWANTASMNGGLQTFIWTWLGTDDRFDRLLGIPSPPSS